MLWEILTPRYLTPSEYGIPSPFTSTRLGSSTEAALQKCTATVLEALKVKPFSLPHFRAVLTAVCTRSLQISASGPTAMAAVSSANPGESARGSLRSSQKDGVCGGCPRR